MCTVSWEQSRIGDSKQKNKMTSLHFDELWLHAVYIVNLSVARLVARGPAGRWLQRRSGEF